MKKDRNKYNAVIFIIGLYKYILVKNLSFKELNLMSIINK